MSDDVTKPWHCPVCGRSVRFCDPVRVIPHTYIGEDPPMFDRSYIQCVPTHDGIRNYSNP